MSGSNSIFIVASILGPVIFLGMYFLPSIVGFVRKRDNLTAIAVLNTLLGWTLIGWVVSLVWALSNNAQQTIIIHNHNSGSEDQG